MLRGWFLLALVACTPHSPSGPGLAHTAWRAAAFHQGGTTLAVPPGEPLTLRFLDKEHVAGQADCNAFQGTYRQRGQHLSFHHLAGTKKGCGPSSHGALFLHALRGVTRFERHGGRLMLYAPDVRIEMEPMP